MRYLMKEPGLGAGDCICQTYTYSWENHYCEASELQHRFEKVCPDKAATFDFQKFMAIQAKGGDVENGKDVVDNVIDSVVEKLSERQLVIYKIIRKSVVDGVVETASSIASKIKLSPRTIQRDLTRLKDLFHF